MARRARIFLSGLLPASVKMTQRPSLVMMKSDDAMARKFTVLIPLYVYPLPEAWKPLFQMATDHPDINFTVVINPNSGPGDGLFPDANYARDISALNKMSNVRAIGYVATHWGCKDTTKVLQEINTYSGWSSKDSAVALDGVFFDETPARFDPGHVQYLRTISEAVRSAAGLGSGYVALNPGCVPAMQYYDDPSFMTLADVTVVFEEAYQTWISRKSHMTLASLPQDHSRLGCLLHSVPAMEEQSLKALLQQMVGVGAYVYLTGTNNYTSFSPNFPDFVKALNGVMN